MSARSATLFATAMFVLGGSAALAAPAGPPPKERPPSSADGDTGKRQRGEGKTEQERKKLPPAQSSEQSTRGRDRAEQGGTDARGSQGSSGATTGSTGQGGSPGSGASSGSGGTADQR